MRDFNLVVFTEDCFDVININQHKNNTNIIIIDKYNSTTNTYGFSDFYIICADYLLILAQSSVISYFQNFFLLNQSSTIYCISPNIKSTIEELFINDTQDVQFQIIDESKDNNLFKKEISLFLKKCELNSAKCKNNMKRIQKIFWEITQRCISGFLIKFAYLNSKYDRLIHYQELFAGNKADKQIKVKKDEIIELQMLSIGSASHIYLVFLINERKICVLKIFIENEDSEHKLFKRERDNYMNIHHPLFPRYFGETEFQSLKCLLIEYIEGQTLENINLNELSTFEKMKIILEIMIIFEYLHSKNYIYRDLKMNNIIIDSDKRAFLIDFDRMIQNPNNHSENIDIILTKDFAHQYIAPEIISKELISSKADIYSIGLLILDIISNEHNLTKLNDLCKKCLILEPDERPNITELIDTFYVDFFSKIFKINISDKAKPNHGTFFFIYWFLISESQNVNIQIELAKLYKNGFYIWKDMDENIQYTPKKFFNMNETNCEFLFISPDISKSICYYSLAADQNDCNAQCKLGLIYLKGKLIPRDISKSIHYFVLAANHYHPIALFNLGVIYLEGKYAKLDIEKAIHCRHISILSYLNFDRTQYILGTIYYDGKYVQRDIKKAIYYLVLAANQNNFKAQFNLGVIYFDEQNNFYDINKAIYYFQLAANQNDVKAQFNLGNIYFTEKYGKYDINKAIYYFQLAANQNDVKSQFNLGNIYYKYKYASQDINKAIHYYTLAANQSHSESQFILGIIYTSKKKLTYDIEKSIHYLTLAADQNHLDAQFLLGTIYNEIDISKAIYYYTLAADQNHLDAQMNLGIIYLNSDINKAIHYLSLAANQNRTDAQHALGTFYYNGMYVARDINKAIHYFSLAASQNIVEDQIILGTIYIDGNYVERDIEKAIYYFEQAAKQNYISAQFNLGMIFFDKQYNLYDISKAIHYFSLAASQNMPKSQYILGLIYSTDIYVAPNIDKAIHYFTLASNQNYEKAQVCLGEIYEKGIYVPRDINRAIYYYLLAANQNNPEAQYYLGSIYYKGNYVMRDIKKAIHFYQLAADQNEMKALFALINILYEGKHVQRDIRKAIHYLTLVANSNIPEAQYNLGVIYYNKQCVFHDINKAIHYFTLAANQSYPKAQYILGLIYYFNIFNANKIKKGRYYLILASKNGHRPANFAHGFLLHEGKNIEKNIEEAIYYYKEASSFNNQYAKNNLGIIYKEGYGDKIKKNVANAVIYFEEAIRQKNDYLSMYNLAHTYIYDETVNKDISKSIDLLFKSSNILGYSVTLLSLALIKKFDFNYENIKKEIDNHKELTTFASELLFHMIEKIFLNGKSYFKLLYELYKNIYFVYDITKTPVFSLYLNSTDKIYSPLKNPKAKDITSEFYNGFGMDLL